MAMHLLRFGALFRRHYAVNLRLDALLLDDQIRLHLCMLGRQRAHLSLFEVVVFGSGFDLLVRISEFLLEPVNRCAF